MNSTIAIRRPPHSVAIVNESFARSFFGSESALGRHVTSVGITYEIVGVVRDAKYQDLREAIAEDDVRGVDAAGARAVVQLQLCCARGPRQPVASVVGGGARCPRGRPGLAPGAAVELFGANRQVHSSERLMATVGGLLGLLALLLAAIGIFGVLAFQVARRTNELGVRTALGASRWSLMHLVFQGCRVDGDPWHRDRRRRRAHVDRPRTQIALWPDADRARRLPRCRIDPRCAALLAAWVPARRASTVDPLSALRHE